MAPDLSNYQGREQAYVKHVFLALYLESLLYKIARRFPAVTYVDGYAGPWLSANENFADTSFGIALNILRSVKSRLREEGINVVFRAVLVERNADAFGKLEVFGRKFSDIQVSTLHGDFHSHLPEITRLSNNSFVFAFIDPKGWSVDVAALKPLLENRNCEIVFNLMFDFVNRFKFLDSVKSSLDRLFSETPNWQAQIESADNPSAKLLDTFRENLSLAGKFPYCLYTEILKKDRNRVLYALYYASRHQRGLEVFRDVQFEALRAQGLLRADAKQKSNEARTGQGGLFSGPELFAVEDAFRLETELQRARDAIIDRVPDYPESVKFEDLVGHILSSFQVRKIHVGRIVGELKRAEVLDWSNSTSRQMVGKDGQRVWKAPRTTTG